MKWASMKYLLFIVLLVAVVIAAGCIGGNQNSPVTSTPVVTSTATNQSNAMFGVTAYYGPAPLTVNFINHGSEAESYIWDFGDGSTSSLYSPRHTFTNPGKYEVTLLATNAIGWTKPSLIITVETPQPQTTSIPTPKPTPYIDPILQIKNKAQTISYDDLFRYNEKYIGDIVYFRGKIIQVMPVSGGAADEYYFRIATSGYSDIILVYYKGSRYLEGDTIDLWARVTGLRSYTALMGNEVTVPELDASYVELVSKASGTYAEGSTTISQNPQEIFKDVTHASVYVTTKNWDADAANDGIVIYPDLLDASDQTVEFSGVKLPVDIEIYTTKYDKNYKTINDQMLYNGRSSISSSDDGNMFMGGGIRVPFESIAQIPNKNYGRVIIKIHTPDGKIYETLDDYAPISP
jgi:PKD repeat protein